MKKQVRIPLLSHAELSLGAEISVSMEVMLVSGKFYFGIACSDSVQTIEVAPPVFEQGVWHKIVLRAGRDFLSLRRGCENYPLGRVVSPTVGSVYFYIPFGAEIQFRNVSFRTFKGERRREGM